VYECKDPVTSTRAFIGTHVSRAARIEPVTPPGEVYASESVAFSFIEARCDFGGVAFEVRLTKEITSSSITSRPTSRSPR